MKPLTKEFLIERGYCCGHKCMNCPYVPKHTKGSTKEFKFNFEFTKKRRFNIGDMVEIIGNIPFKLKNAPRPILGRIVNINGAYIDVRPLYRRWIAEFYSNELRLL